MASSARFAALSVVSSRQPKSTLKEYKPQSEIWGEDTFGTNEMKARLPKDVYAKLRETALAGKALDASIAPAVAHAMKEWAITHGATHFTHWFQPMTGVTAEKHDAFIMWDGEGGVIERFGAKELVQSEPDASSFPSGGLRATFEARGYTAWDPTSPAFLMNGPNGRTLCIPSVFLSYTGECLDEKAPLLRSIRALSDSAVRLLRVLGDDKTESVHCNVGPEQEYFLIDKSFHDLRPDLLAAGRTVLGGTPAKGQQLEDQYFGAVQPRVLAVMAEAEQRLIKLGVPVKTRHNEVAPHQFEVAPIFEPSNRAADHNLLIMEVFKRVANEHGLAFLTHEKPFQGINGSGKHNNWSMGTNLGENLLEPGNTPVKNLRFLVFMLATVRAVHEHGGLLRSAVASASNDHRLGANEAPPAIMSVFLGDELSDVLDRIEKGKGGTRENEAAIDLGVHTLPAVAKDTTDRNRTSPFAFTGNKFEFRAVGASMNISWANTVLNTMVAESLDWMAQRIQEEKKGAKDVGAAVVSVLKRTIKEVRPVLFNGDNYSDEWHAEAKKRGLANDKDTPSALKHLTSARTRKLFSEHKVLTEVELHSRHHVRLERYAKTVAIEAAVTAEMVRTGVIPAAVEQLGRYAQTAATLSNVRGVDSATVSTVAELTNQLGGLLASVKDNVRRLEDAAKAAAEVADVEKQADAYGHNVLKLMKAVRADADAIEGLVDDGLWPYPKYREMLFQI
ncbi:MAG: glutamine synthetase III [Myxococcota bacterium]